MSNNVRVFRICSTNKEDCINEASSGLIYPFGLSGMAISACMSEENEALITDSLIRVHKENYLKALNKTEDIDINRSQYKTDLFIFKGFKWASLDKEISCLTPEDLVNSDILVVDSKEDSFDFEKLMDIADESNTDILLLDYQKELEV